MTFDSTTTLKGNISASAVTEVLTIPSSDLLSAKVMINSLTGTSPTVQFTFQSSIDGSTFSDVISTKTYTESTKDFQEFYFAPTGDYVRVSVTVSGTVEYTIGFN